MQIICAANPIEPTFAGARLCIRRTCNGESPRDGPALVCRLPLITRERWKRVKGAGKFELAGKKFLFPAGEQVNVQWVYPNSGAVTPTVGRI